MIMFLANKLEKMGVHPRHRVDLSEMLVLLFILAFIQLFAWLSPVWPSSKGVFNFLVWHNILEVISIVISMMVFLVGCNSRHKNMSGSVVLLACAFFSVGLLDFFHTLSYFGMPEFFSPNDIQKQLNYWLLARFLAALVFLFVAVKKWESPISSRVRNILFSTMLLMTFSLHWIVIYHQSWFPDTFILGQGLTQFKKNSEYIIVLMNLLAAAILLNKMSKSQPYKIAMLFGAVCTLAMSEFYFTLYVTMHGSYILLGHIYKVIGYLLIFRAVVIEVIEEPYNLLEKEKSKFSSIFDSINDGVELISADGHILDINRVSCERWGYRKEELIGKPIGNFNTVATALQAAERITQIRKFGSLIFEAERVCKNGVIAIVEVSCCLIVLDGQEIFLGTSRDITERELNLTRLQQSQEASRASEDRYRSLVEQATDGIFLVNSQGYYIDANLPGLQMLGYSREELLKLTFVDVLDPSEIPKLGLQFANLATGEPVISEWVFLRKDGSTFIGEVRGNLLANDFFLSVLIDITERKNKEMALFESERRWKFALEGSYLGVWERNLVTDKMILTKRYEEILGFAEGEFRPTGDMWRSSIHPDDKDRILNKLQAYIDGKELAYFTDKYKILCKDGRYKWVSAHAMIASRDVDGKPLMLIGTLTDIDAQKKIEEEIKSLNAHLEQRVMERTAQLQQVSQVKDAFLATMSHEVRTPLGGMIGMMELISKSPLSPEQRQQLEIAQLSGKNLLRIVNDILDWSKIEAGKLELTLSNVSIAEVLHIVANTYAQLASDKGVKLITEIDPLLSGRHLLDPLRLAQILHNFTSNAVKFTQQGDVTISAERIELRAEIETIRFSVKDNGMGITLEQQSRLFNHFEQATADIARMYGGTGLGLAICRRLAELMDGTLSVESSLGVGSIFSFTVNLPVAKLTESSNQSLNKIKQPETVAEVTPLVNKDVLVRILVVDDHPVNRMLLKQQLGSLGLQVQTAEDGARAFELCQSSHFDLIITDCHMPVMDGYELTRRIREQEQQTRGSRIPIIAWTANVLVEESEKTQLAGMDDLLTKPTQLSEIRSKLSKWLPKTLIVATDD